MGSLKQDNGMEIRDVLFHGNKRRLEELAYRAIHKKKLLPEDFVIVCINANDLSWADLVEHLMPGHDWQQYRDRKEKPVARGIVYASICDYLKKAVPGIADALVGALPEGYVRAVVLDDGGASVYNIQPAPGQQVYH